MLRIEINDAIANFVARPRPDGGWDLRCLDTLVGEFHLRSGDALQVWSEDAGEWFLASGMDLAELAVRETEKRIKNMSYGTPYRFLDDLGRHCGKQPANFGISWRDDDSGSEDAVWYCLSHFKEMQAAESKPDLLPAHIVAMPLDERE